MFFKKSTFALAFVALASIATAGSTPACVLSVIGDTNNPADVATICGVDAKKTESAITDKCGGSDSAMQFFANTCAENGHKLEISSSLNPTSTSGSATATSTESGFVTAISTSGSQATGSSSGASRTSSGASGSASATAPVLTGAAISERQLSGTTLAAAVLVGVAAWL